MGKGESQAYGLLFQRVDQVAGNTSALKWPATRDKRHWALQRKGGYEENTMIENAS